MSNIFKHNILNSNPHTKLIVLYTSHAGCCNFTGSTRVLCLAADGIDRCSVIHCTLMWLWTSSFQPVQSDTPHHWITCSSASSSVWRIERELLLKSTSSIYLNQHHRSQHLFKTAAQNTFSVNRKNQNKQNWSVFM